MDDTPLSNVPTLSPCMAIATIRRSQQEGKREKKQERNESLSNLGIPPGHNAVPVQKKWQGDHLCGPREDGQRGEGGKKKGRKRFLNQGQTPPDQEKIGAEMCKTHSHMT